MTLSQSDLAGRLRQKWETDRQEIEETGARELRRLGESLSSAARSAQRSIDADMAAWTGRTRSLLMRAWLLPAAMGLSLFLAISGGSWATMRWLSASIEDRLQALAVLNVDIEQARETLAEMEETTWGVELREIDGERFVVLPAGTLDYPPWTVGGWPAVKLPSELGHCMTELERQLMTALRALSAQYQAEQQRHSEQVEALQQRVKQQAAQNETLRQRIERLSGQVTCLDAHYRTLAETLRGRWN